MLSKLNRYLFSSLMPLAKTRVLRLKKLLSFLQIPFIMKKTTLLIICVNFLFAVKGICSTNYTLLVTNYGNPTIPSEFNSLGYSIDGNVVEYNVCGPSPSIHIAIIDSVSCNPLNNCNKNFGQ